MNRLLFALADFLARPPGFYWVMGAMAISTLLVPLGFTDVVTYGLSVAAIIITGVVLIQGYRDTAAIHVKLDEIIVALRGASNTAVGLEHGEIEDIEKAAETVEAKAEGADAT